MKPRVFIPPVAAIIASAIFLTSQRRAISEIASETAVLAKTPAVTSIDSGTPADLVSAWKKSAPGKSINWRRIGETGVQRSKGVFAQQEWLRFQKRVQSMTPAELISALDEVDELDGDGQARDTLWRELITSLGEKDPEAAMNRLTDNPQFRYFGKNTEILSKWATKNPAAAIAWLDGKIAAGTFHSTSPDGKNQTHLRYEASLLSVLLKDSEAAAKRFATIPEKHRAGMLSEFFMSGGPTSDAELKTYVDLIRKMIPEHSQPELITNPVRQLARAAGFEKIDRYLDRIEATPAERSRSVGIISMTKGYALVSGNRLNTSELDKLRSWIATQAPDKIESTTAGILHHAVMNLDSGFDRSVELALHYQETTGKDDILVGFLSHSFSSTQKERARELADRITDTEQREKALQYLNR